MVAHGDFPLSQTAEATISSTTPSMNWDTIDAEFRFILAACHSLCLASDEVSPSEAGDIFSSLLRVHLERYNVMNQPGHTTKDCSSEVIRKDRESS